MAANVVNVEPQEETKNKTFPFAMEEGIAIHSIEATSSNDHVNVQDEQKLVVLVVQEVVFVQKTNSAYKGGKHVD